MHQLVPRNVLDLCEMRGKTSVRMDLISSRENRDDLVKLKGLGGRLPSGLLLSGKDAIQQG